MAVLHAQSMHFSTKNVNNFVMIWKILCKDEISARTGVLVIYARDCVRASRILIIVLLVAEIEDSEPVRD